MSTNQKQTVTIIGALDPNISWPEVYRVQEDGSCQELTANELEILQSQIESKLEYVKNCEAIDDIKPNTLYYFPKNQWYLLSVIENRVVFFQRANKEGQVIGDKYGASMMPVYTLKEVAKQPKALLQQAA